MSPHDGDVGEELIVSQGEKLVKEEPSLVYVSIAPRGSSTRLICFVGPKAKEAGVAADALVRELAKAARRLRRRHQGVRPGGRSQERSKWPRRRTCSPSPISGMIGR